MLIVKRIYKNYAPLFNKFTSISVNLDESEAMKFYNLDEIELGPSCTYHVVVGIYSTIYSSQYLHTSSVPHHALHILYLYKCYCFLFKSHISVIHVSVTKYICYPDKC